MATRSERDRGWLQPNTEAERKRCSITILPSQQPVDDHDTAARCDRTRPRCSLLFGFTGANVGQVPRATLLSTTVTLTSSLLVHEYERDASTTTADPHHG